MITPPPPNKENTNIVCAVSALNPLNEWCTSEYTKNVFPSCLFDGKVTLVVCRSNMFAAALMFTYYWKSEYYNLDSPLYGPVYLRGDEYPYASHFLTELQNSKIRLGLGRVSAVAKNEFQDFPLSIECSPNAEKVWFRWVIVNKEMPPWAVDKNYLSKLENTLEATEHKPQLIILDGFPWNGSMVELKKMLIRLKEKKCSVIILTNKLPPGNFAANAIWDNIIRIKPWRSWRCSPYNLVLHFQRANGCQVNIQRHILSTNGGNSWLEKQDSYIFLKPLIVAWMRNDKTSAQIVHLINSNQNLYSNLKRPMTISNLARLKREWSLRSYKPERKPRKPKTKKNQSPNSSSAE